ncbi:Hypothetical protein NTJ_12249 [Nesidiocoris tenuis]|uniref:Uncharacterized protein n=1 Tax=Nesidiocoris tenuis TaxID=355587 RepID=A0ABN7B4V3_9HEMI|nr:Hypothetical protein NTJ_12249 [Nesidiocoris tenuis]
MMALDPLFQSIQEITKMPPKARIADCPKHNTQLDPATWDEASALLGRPKWFQVQQNQFRQKQSKKVTYSYSWRGGKRFRQRTPPSDERSLPPPTSSTRAILNFADDEDVLRCH